MKFLLSLLLFIPLLSFGAEVDTPQDISGPPLFLSSSNTALSVPSSGNTVLLDLDVRKINRIFVIVTPTTNAFDAFIVQINNHPSGTLQTIASTAANYTAPAGIMVGASSDLTTLAAGATGWFILDTTGLYRVVVSASAAAAGAATVTAYAGGY